MEIFNEIKYILHTKMGFADKKIYPKSNLRDDLGMDSLDLVELTLLTEAEFHCEIDDGLALKIRTIEDLMLVVKSKLIKT